MIFTNVVRSVRFHFRFGGSIRSMSKRQKSGWLVLAAGNWNTLLSPPPSNLSADAMANCTMKPISCNAVHQPCLPSCQSCEPTCSSNPSRSPIPETSLIAGAIHHDLGGHRILHCKLPEFYARFRLTRSPTTERSRSTDRETRLFDHHPPKRKA
jgi:hypothetical protein